MGINKPDVIREFTAGTLRDIERNRGVVFNPLETFLARLREEGRPFAYITHEDDKQFMKLLSINSQVAILPVPNKFYVPESNNKGLKVQKVAQQVDLDEVIKKKFGIGGVDSIVGNAATDSGIAFAYFDLTKGRIRLFGRDYSYGWVRNTTPTRVGRWREKEGLTVGDWASDDVDPEVWLYRLLVPAQE